MLHHVAAAAAHTLPREPRAVQGVNTAPASARRGRSAPRRLCRGAPRPHIGTHAALLTPQPAAGLARGAGLLRRRRAPAPIVSALANPSTAAPRAGPAARPSHPGASQAGRQAGRHVLRVARAPRPGAGASRDGGHGQRVACGDGGARRRETGSARLPAAPSPGPPGPLPGPSRSVEPWSVLQMSSRSMEAPRKGSPSASMLIRPLRANDAPRGGAGARVRPNANGGGAGGGAAFARGHGVRAARRARSMRASPEAAVTRPRAAPTDPVAGRGMPQGADPDCRRPARDCQAPAPRRRAAARGVTGAGVGAAGRARGGGGSGGGGAAAPGVARGAGARRGRAAPRRGARPARRRDFQPLRSPPMLPAASEKAPGAGGRRDHRPAGCGSLAARGAPRGPKSRPLAARGTFPPPQSLRLHPPSLPPSPQTMASAMRAQVGVWQGP
jgi:hypothetical protein